MDDTLLSIEESLDEAESDLDYMTVGGVLTVHCESGAQVIFTRQVAVSQLWVATPDGGFHFDYDAEQSAWLNDNTAEPLSPFLQQVFAKHAKETFDFKL